MPRGEISRVELGCSDSSMRVLGVVVKPFIDLNVVRNASWRMMCCEIVECVGWIVVCCKHQIVVWDDLLWEGGLQLGVMSAFTDYGQTVCVIRCCQEWTLVEDDFHTVIREFGEMMRWHEQSGWNRCCEGVDCGGW